MFDGRIWGEKIKNFFRVGYGIEIEEKLKGSFKKYDGKKWEIKNENFLTLKHNYKF